jgi:hypothetical protein
MLKWFWRKYLNLCSYTYINVDNLKPAYNISAYLEEDLY